MNRTKTFITALISLAITSSAVAYDWVFVDYWQANLYKINSIKLKGEIYYNYATEEENNVWSLTELSPASKYRAKIHMQAKNTLDSEGEIRFYLTSAARISNIRDHRFGNGRVFLSDGSTSFYLYNGMYLPSGWYTLVFEDVSTGDKAAFDITF